MTRVDVGHCLSLACQAVGDASLSHSPGANECAHPVGPVLWPPRPTCRHAPHATRQYAAPVRGSGLRDRTVKLAHPRVSDLRMFDFKPCTCRSTNENVMLAGSNNSCAELESPPTLTCSTAKQLLRVGVSFNSDSQYSYAAAQCRCEFQASGSLVDIIDAGCHPPINQAKHHYACTLAGAHAAMHACHTPPSQPNKCAGSAHSTPSSC